MESENTAVPMVVDHVTTGRKFGKKGKKY